MNDSTYYLLMSGFLIPSGREEKFQSIGVITWQKRIDDPSCLTGNFLPRTGL